MMGNFAFVGAVYIDTILTTPSYPERDSKLRATSQSVRRGGNSPNSLEILSQYRHNHEPTSKKPILIASLPTGSSLDYDFISKSLPDVRILSSATNTEVAPRSYIIRDAETHSRTIVNYNGLDELTYAELEHLFVHEELSDTTWWHFEGRNTDAISPFIGFIRKSQPSSVIISLEIEKPGRDGLAEIANLCDFVFYSKSWATHAGYTSLTEFLRSESMRLQQDQGATSELRTQAVFCTWGEGGSGAVEIPTTTDTVHECGAVLPPGEVIVDTVGAGDVFIGSMISQLARTCSARYSSHNTTPLDLDRSLREANMLCGLKLCQEGFANLVEKLQLGRA